MSIAVNGGYRLRRPEPKDIDALYTFKNDEEVAGYLGGFSTGYSMAAIADWITAHSVRADEIVWVIADEKDDRCVGHAGFYKIDHRSRNAEFALMIGEKSLWGKRLGRAVTEAALLYGFRQLNLMRVYLSVLATNERACRLYLSLGFMEEGTLRKAQFKGGRYIDIKLMALLNDEYENGKGTVISEESHNLRIDRGSV